MGGNSGSTPVQVRHIYFFTGVCIILVHNPSLVQNRKHQAKKTEIITLPHLSTMASIPGRTNTAILSKEQQEMDQGEGPL